MVTLHLTIYIILTIIIFTCYYIYHLKIFNFNFDFSGNNTNTNTTSNKQSVNQDDTLLLLPNENITRLEIDNKINTDINLTPFLPIKQNFQIIDNNRNCVTSNSSEKCNLNDLSQLWSFNGISQIINNFTGLCLNNDLSSNNCRTLSEINSELKDQFVCIKDLNQKWSLDQAGNLITTKNNKTTNSYIIK